MNVHIKQSFQNFAIEMLGRLEASRTDKQMGEASFKAFEHWLYTDLLFSVLEFPEEVPENEAKRIVQSAVSAAARKGEVTRSSFLRESNLHLKQYLSQDEQRYVLVSSVSINFLDRLTQSRFRFGSTDIIFERRHPARFRKQAEQLRETALKIYRHEEPKDYLAVRVHVTARSVHEAAGIAFDRLDLLRGIWNWRYNLDRHRMSSRFDLPMNEIVLGPVHTLHSLSGEIAAPNIWWYQPEYNGSVRPFGFSAHQNDLLGFLRKTRRALRRHNYRQDMERAIIGYTQALDEPRPDIAFRKLWGIFEFLTNVEPGKPGQGTSTAIKRTTFFLTDRRYHKKVLERLRDHRHDLVHRDAQSIAITSYLNHLKAYVEKLMLFHLENAIGAESLAEANLVYGTTTDRGALKKKEWRLKQAIKMLGYE